MMTGSSAGVAIIGGGITGLTAAWQLRAQGIDATVFEKSCSVGGRTGSVRKGGFVFDTGAITMLPTYDNTCALIEALGIGVHLRRLAPIIGIPRNGKIHDLDLNHPLKSVLSTQLISLSDKLKLLKLVPLMARAWRRARYDTLSPLEPWDNESIASWAERELNHNIHNYVLGPIIRGNTLNATESAPLGELLWMLKGYSAPFVQNFDMGINFLAESLARTAKIKFDHEVHQVRSVGRGVELVGASGAGEFKASFDRCIVALSPLDIRALDVAIPEAQRRFFDEFKPLPSINFHFGLSRRPDIKQTFVLPPESESAALTTIVMDHNKAPGRAPEGKGVVSLFCRDDWCAANFTRPEEALIAEVLQMAKPFVGDISADIECHHVQRWPYAIIKSEPGVYRKIAHYEAAADLSSPVQLAGDFLSMGMEAAVCSGIKAAERILNLTKIESKTEEEYCHARF